MQTIKNKKGIRKAIDTAEKTLSGRGRGLVRYSGKQSLCGVMVEGQDEKKTKGFTQKIAQLIGRSSIKSL